MPPNFGSACAVLNNSVVSVGGYDCSGSLRKQVQLNTSACILCSQRMHLLQQFLFSYQCAQVFTGRAASFSELHGSVMVTSAIPSTISTIGATIITLLGTNLCRRNVHVTVESSHSAVYRISSKSIVVRTPAGLNRRPSLNLTFSLLSYVTQSHLYLLTLF